MNRKEFEYVVKDKIGIHARPASLLVKEAIILKVRPCRRLENNYVGKRVFNGIIIGRIWVCGNKKCNQKKLLIWDLKNVL